MNNLICEYEKIIQYLNKYNKLTETNLNGVVSYLNSRYIINENYKESIFNSVVNISDAIKDLKLWSDTLAEFRIILEHFGKAPHVSCNLIIKEYLLQIIFVLQDGIRVQINRLNVLIK